MTPLAPLLQSFFIERLANQRHASQHTIAAYRLSFSLLLRFARDRLQKAPSDLGLEDLDAPLIVAFLRHLESERGNSTQTRNARLAAIRSFYRYLAVRVPDLADQIKRVLDLPCKRFDRELVAYLTREELEALLAAPDRTSWLGRRDHALLLVAIQTGLRASELVNLRRNHIVPGQHSHVRCMGKGRKERCVPLTRQTMSVLRNWLDLRGGGPLDLIFPSSRRGMLSLDALEKLVNKHATAAARACLSIGEKHVTPHVLRHTAAMQLRQAGVDLSVIALWLGHESLDTTQIYLQADLASRETALSRLAEVETGYRRFQPTDRLLAFLQGL
jgi:integrase/recombinase XerD